MILRTVIRDCLVLAWSVPLESVPELPGALRPERRVSDDGDRALAFGLCFFHEGIRLAALPIVRFSYPQFGLALAVKDGNGVPSLLFRRLMVPGWVRPAVRLMVRQPTEAAHLSFDRPSKSQEIGRWSWSVEQGGAGLAIAGKLGAPGRSEVFPSWSAAVEGFRGRRRGYFATASGYRRLESCLPETDPWPLSVEVEDSGLLASCLPAAEGAPETAMLFSELPLTFELAKEPALARARGRRVPQPAPSRRSGLCV